MAKNTVRQSKGSPDHPEFSHVFQRSREQVGLSCDFLADRGRQDMRSKPFRKLPHSVIVRAPGLLPMLYSPGELIEELGIPNRTLRDWLDKGAPHRRDGGRIWINGREFAEWVKQKGQAGRGPG